MASVGYQNASAEERTVSEQKLTLKVLDAKISELDRNLSELFEDVGDVSGLAERLANAETAIMATSMDVNLLINVVRAQLGPALFNSVVEGIKVELQRQQQLQAEKERKDKEVPQVPQVHRG